MFDKSLALAEAHKDPYEYAQTQLLRGQIGLECGWPDAEQQVAEARESLHALTVQHSNATTEEAAAAESTTLSLVDRFGTVLDSGRRIASALSPADVFTEVRQRGPASAARRTVSAAPRHADGRAAADRTFRG